MKKTLLAALIMGLTGAAHAEQKVVAGYFADWQYANAENPYTVNDIPADKLTHVIYAFLSMCGPHTGASETVQKLVAEQCEGKDPYTAIIVDTEAAWQIKADVLPARPKWLRAKVPQGSGVPATLV